MSLGLSKNDVVLLASQNRIGVVKYIGPLPNGTEQTYVGVEIEEGNGDCSGSYQGVEYFKCKEKKGLFVGLSDIKKKLEAFQILKQMYVLSEKK